MWSTAASRRRTISGHPAARGSIGAPIVTVMGACRNSHVPSGRTRRVPAMATGTIGRPVSTAARKAPNRNGSKPGRTHERALGKDHQPFAVPQPPLDFVCAGQAIAEAGFLDREVFGLPNHGADQRIACQRALGDEVKLRGNRRHEDDRIDVAGMIGDEDARGQRTEVFESHDARTDAAHREREARPPPGRAIRVTTRPPNGQIPPQHRQRHQQARARSSR